jgi:hypothetical protein
MTKQTVGTPEEWLAACMRNPRKRSHWIGRRGAPRMGHERDRSRLLRDPAKLLVADPTRREPISFETDGDRLAGHLDTYEWWNWHDEYGDAQPSQEWKAGRHRTRGDEERPRGWRRLVIAHVGGGPVEETLLPVVSLLGGGLLVARGWVVSRVRRGRARPNTPC